MEKLSFAVLQKKLEELESSLSEVIDRPFQTSCHDHELEIIKNRFGFLKSLLSAEIESHPHMPPGLQCITQRVSELEKVFQEWDNLRTSPLPLLLPPPIVDSSSSCSCTESCLNEQGDDESCPNSNHGNELSDTGIIDCPSYQEPKSAFQKAVEENSSVLMVTKVEEEMRMDTRDGSAKTSLVVFMFALVALSVAIITRHCGICCYYEGEMNTFPTPT